MKPRTVVLVALLAVALLFVGLNWRAFTNPTTLNFAFGQIEAPLGVLMLLALAILTLLYLLLLAKAEAAAHLEIRRLSKELEKTRKLADSAEASRFKELRQWLEGELGALRQQLAGRSSGDGGGDPAAEAEPD